MSCPSLPLLLQTVRYHNGRPCALQQRILPLLAVVLGPLRLMMFFHMRPPTFDHFLQRCERADERGVVLDGFGVAVMEFGLLVHGGVDVFVGDVVCFDEGASDGGLELEDADGGSGERGGVIVLLGCVVCDVVCGMRLTRWGLGLPIRP